MPEEVVKTKIIRLLIVDDEETQAELIKLNLESSQPSFKITATPIPSQAIILFKAQPFDCIVSDYQMPEMNGVQLCTEVRKTSTVPFILYTGKGSEEVASTAFGAGVDDYVRKEKELNHYHVLARRITHAVERRRAEAEVERLASFPEFNPNPVIEADFAGKINYLNPAATHEFPALSRAGMITPQMLIWGDVLTQLKLEAKAIIRDVEIDGVWYSLAIHSVPSVDMMRIYATNIDDRKKGEQALKELVEELASTAEELRTSNEELVSLGEELRVANEHEREQASRLEGLVHERTTKLRESEEGLRAASHYTRSLIEASLDPLVTIDVEGKITDVNEATIQATGATREELVGSEFADYFTEPEKAREDRMRTFAEGSTRDFPLTIRHKSGKLIEVLYNATLYKDAAGDTAGMLAAARDVTEKNRIERKLFKTEVIAAVEQLGATVAHDLRGPLGRVIQAVNLIKRDPSLTPRMLKIVEEGAVRSLKMIADWRSNTRKIVPQPVESDLASLLKHIIAENMIPGNVEVASSVGESLGSVYIDPGIMHRVLNNLVKNAVEAMPNGGKLSITAEKEGDALEIKVGDTGIGIPVEAQERIFSPLFTTKSGGFGLGLVYCRRAVEAMGGSINFESEVSKGTAFTIRLPVHES